MVTLACSVRGCGRALTGAGATLRCPAGHAFDRAAEGYWNLLQPQDRRAKVPGDSPESTDARSRWIERGLAEPLAEAIAGLTRPFDGAGRSFSIDVGCGEGFWVRRLFPEHPERVCGIDLSVRAVKRAARRACAATWVVANADRFLPLPSGSVALALSIFGRRPVAELARVLGPGGQLVVAVPAADDLIELREAAFGQGDPRERVPGVVGELAPSFRLADRREWRRRVALDRKGIEDALAMTYRGARRSERSRIEGLDELVVTLAAEILVFEPDATDNPKPEVA